MKKGAVAHLSLGAVQRKLFGADWSVLSPFFQKEF
jgi:hypothetical protein